MALDEGYGNSSFEEVLGVPIESLREFDPYIEKNLARRLEYLHANIEASRARAPKLAKIVELIIRSGHPLSRAALTAVQAEQNELLDRTLQTNGIDRIFPIDPSLYTMAETDTLADPEVVVFEYWRDILSAHCAEVVEQTYRKQSERQASEPMRDAAYMGRETLYFLTIGANGDLARQNDIPA